ncbi:LytR/AlgR family response regulator transcription factor [Pedobacter caeni]|uniref:Two component transcriptional regulator, LytTR family n=1 Tax=Pedobacter caeni TaxID=288992 RepID=A0A1M4T7L5_9SPHI|nr:LytTR family DNA-binding domain-containing protein [Pedobacter caeni]SHE40415.1 two component transcriptional regulator, LytTR family [Pedobacter caeni]
MTPYKCVIIDHDLDSINGLQRYLSLMPELVLVNTYTDPLLALTEIKSCAHLDIILTDIEMPDIAGTEFFNDLRHKASKLVFTTANTQYASETLGLNADAYLVKPYSLINFVTMIVKLLTDQPVEQPVSDHYPFFFVKNKQNNARLTKIDFADVIAVESKLNDVMIHTVHEKILTSISLTEVARLLQRDNRFVKVQRSFIINTHHIVHIDGNTIKMNQGTSVTVGEQYRTLFAEFVTGRLLKSAVKK